MNVKDLKGILDKLPEDMPIFIDMDSGQLNAVDWAHVTRVRSDQYDSRWPDRIILDETKIVHRATKPVLTIFP